MTGDKAARAVVEPGTPGLAEIAETFGAGVLRPDGSLDRARLAAIVFSDEAARAKLNAITHPLIHAHIQAAEEAVVAAGGPDTIVVHYIPLLAEGQRAADFKLVIVVDVPPEVQIARLGARGLPEDQARAPGHGGAGDSRAAAGDRGHRDRQLGDAGPSWTCGWGRCGRSWWRGCRGGCYGWGDPAVGRGWTATG